MLFQFSLPVNSMERHPMFACSTTIYCYVGATQTQPPGTQIMKFHLVFFIHFFVLFFKDRNGLIHPYRLFFSRGSLHVVTWCTSSPIWDIELCYF